MKDRDEGKMRNEDSRNSRIGALVSLCLNLAFYLVFPLVDGPVWCKDSLSYTTMDCSREPLYPLFLMLLRDRFGDGNLPYGQPLYLFIAALFQSAFAGLAVWGTVRTFVSFGRTRRERFLLSLGSTAAFWGVQLLCRFAALRGSAYPESIMTESLGLSFWLLFMVSAFQYLRNHRLRDLILTCLWMFLCIGLRKQLLVCALTFGAAGFLVELLYRKRFSRFLAIVLTCAAAFGGATLFDYACNYSQRGIWMQHTGNAMGIDCTLLYTTTAADADLFQDPDTRELFLEIQQQMEEQHLRYVDNPAGTSWVDLAGHYADAYDVIGYEIMNPVMDAYVLSKDSSLDAGSPQYYLAIDAAEEKLRDGLLHQNPARFLQLWGYNIVKGLVNTILRMNPILIAGAGILYALFLVLLGIRVRQMVRAGTIHLGGGAAPGFCGLILLGILVNALVVGAVIFPQTRYMIYNMGLFYAGLWLLLLQAPRRSGTGGKFVL